MHSPKHTYYSRKTHWSEAWYVSPFAHYLTVEDHATQRPQYLWMAIAKMGTKRTIQKVPINASRYWLLDGSVGSVNASEEQTALLILRCHLDWVTILPILWEIKIISFTIHYHTRTSLSSKNAHRCADLFYMVWRIDDPSFLSCFELTRRAP